MGGKDKERNGRNMLFKKNEDFYDVVGYSRNSLLPLWRCYKRYHSYLYAMMIRESLKKLHKNSCLVIPRIKYGEGSARAGINY
jgi:hypothetical protein